MLKTNCQYNLPFHPDRKITLEFDGGRISSDSGLLPLYLVDRSHHLSRDFAQCLRDERDQRYVVHSIEEMSRQRLYQIASGYEDCNDAETLRQDAALPEEHCPHRDLPHRSRLARLFEGQIHGLLVMGLAKIARSSC